MKSRLKTKKQQKKTNDKKLKTIKYIFDNIFKNEINKKNTKTPKYKNSCLISQKKKRKLKIFA